MGREKGASGGNFGVKRSTVFNCPTCGDKASMLGWRKKGDVDKRVV